MMYMKEREEISISEKNQINTTFTEKKIIEKVKTSVNVVHFIRVTFVEGDEYRPEEISMCWIYMWFL